MPCNNCLFNCTNSPNHCVQLTATEIAVVLLCLCVTPRGLQVGGEAFAARSVMCLLLRLPSTT